MPFLGVALALALYRQVDVLVIAEVAGERDLGWYSAADTLFGSLLFPTTIILASIFPTLGRLHEHDPPEMRRLVTKTFSLLILVSVPVGLGAAVVGERDRPATLWAGVLGDRRPDDDLRAGDDPHIRNDVPRDCEYGPGSPTVRRSIALGVSCADDPARHRAHPLGRRSLRQRCDRRCAGVRGDRDAAIRRRLGSDRSVHRDAIVVLADRAGARCRRRDVRGRVAIS